MGDSINDVETTRTTWGIGANIVTRLLDETGEVRCQSHTLSVTHGQLSYKAIQAKAVRYGPSRSPLVPVLTFYGHIKTAEQRSII